MKISNLYFKVTVIIFLLMLINLLSGVRWILKKRNPKLISEKKNRDSKIINQTRQTRLVFDENKTHAIHRNHDNERNSVI